MGRRRILAELPAESDINKDNYEDGKLRKHRHPIPSTLQIRKGMRLHLTRNVDKAGNFVKGMACEVQVWNDSSKCLRVKTVTGKDVAVFQYFPLRLGYVSTI